MSKNSKCTDSNCNNYCTEVGCGFTCYTTCTGCIDTCIGGCKNGCINTCQDDNCYSRCGAECSSSCASGCTYQCSEGCQTDCNGSCWAWTGASACHGTCINVGCTDVACRGGCGQKESGAKAPLLIYFPLLPKPSPRFLSLGPSPSPQVTVELQTFATTI